MKDYGELLRQARQRAGLSAGQLGELIGETNLNIYNHECSDRAPRLSYCIRLADALHISLDELCGREHMPLYVIMTPKEWRKWQGLARAELADMAGVGRNTILHIETGKHDPSIRIVELIADALGLGIDEYIGHEVK